MKIFITGHTSGLGKFLYESFSKNENNVIGVSRSAGIDILNDTEKVIDLAKDCDLVILNADAAQIQLLEALADKTKIVIMGSIAGQYDQLIQSEYSLRKKLLAERCRSLSLDPKVSLLHLTISMLEDAVSTDTGIPFAKVYKVINDWIENSCYNNIDFEFKLTPFTIDQIKSKFGATDESIKRIMSNVCNDTKKLVTE